jgi:perosamine synthetase
MGAAALSTLKGSEQQVPYFRPCISEEEIAAVVACLRSGWLTTGPRVEQFEHEFAAEVRAKHAIAVNSCTAALHLAVEALGLRAGQAVLVPTLTFASTAEIVRYQGAIPILVDCDPVTLNMDLDDAADKLRRLREGRLPLAEPVQAVGIIPVHVGGAMMDMRRVQQFADQNRLWVVEDAAHAFPAAMRQDPSEAWWSCGENTAAVTCYSFYTNKTITTGEGGMAVTDDAGLAHRMRQMSLHGLSNDAWNRYSGSGSWDYRIVAPGFKYNLTDIAASLGTLQLRRAEQLRLERQAMAANYVQQLQSVDEIELPAWPENRIHAWHLFPIRLHLERLSIDRNEFIQQLRAHGVGCSVHWRPLHLHPYYETNFGWTAADLPVATEQWQRLISLPIFPGMSQSESKYVVDVVRGLCSEFSTRPATGS